MAKESKSKEGEVAEAGVEESKVDASLSMESLSREKIEATSIHVFKQVQTLDFGLLSPKFIKKMSSAKIVTPELYDKEGYPVDGGLMDIRLGVIDPGLRCKTCGARLKDCPGHFGYIELARPVIHIKFATLIYTILQCTCKECSRLLVPEDKMRAFSKYLEKVAVEEGVEAKRNAVADFVSKLKSVNKCPYCKAKQDKVTIEKPTTFFEAERRLNPIEIRTRLEKVSDEDCAFFSINSAVARPEWLVLTVLPIPPVTVRPSITLESGERSEDDLTHKLGDIVRINQRLFENINAGAPEIIIEDLWDLLQYHVTTFFDNSVTQIPPARHRSGQPLKTLTERIKSKEGRIRHNLAGKRTNFCARTVISPDPALRIDEVGVPKVVAMKLTVPEVVNEWNIEYLKKFVENGPKKYPGANYVIRSDGRKKKLTDETKDATLEEIQPGYVVERHLIDGDVAIFNRQPSLHRMSMMCHKVKVLPYKTLRINPAVCFPYNADFDGDEMNFHVPQTEESRAEAEMLLEVQTQLIGPGAGTSLIGCIHDGISGNYLLTKYLSFDRKKAVDILASIGITDFSALPNKKLISGKELFSSLLPEGISYHGKSKSGVLVVIEDGKLVEGVIDKNSIGGEGAGALIPVLHKKFGSEKTITILHNIFKLGIEVLLRHGITSTIADIDVHEGAADRIKNLLDDAEEKAFNVIRDYEQGTLQAYPGRTLEETVELKVLEVLNQARNSCGTIIKEEFREVPSTPMIINSGARGNILNIVQMAACVGQQALRGQRISYGYGGRTLSSFKAGDLSPKAHGFVKSSFRMGLKPVEFFFHAITGRDSLMDTALRTPKSGYLYRRLANALQDLKIEKDGSVRDANGKIIQFLYGEDGIDVSKSESGRIDVDRIIKAG